ncbi:hypothetical protein [Isoalcanivorax beigongshangi]|uniref:Uncharacterized protein n=1 Tax=Isoalcanivorax beigongshangi TaxID=3238810 RepID=A0ABV4AHT1_9GAMM
MTDWFARFLEKTLNMLFRRRLRWGVVAGLPGNPSRCISYAR